MFDFFLLSLLATTALGAPSHLQKRAAPSVTIENGTVIGSTADGIDTFRGIPFAQPPTGTLRLKPPQTITESYGTITATAVPTACPQFFQSVNSSSLTADALGLLLDTPLLQNITVAGEDCLTVNVQRPANATADSNLPVLFWIFGGGFELGSTEFFGVYDATDIMTRAMDMSQPIVYVSVNYRVGGFGFLAGSELAAEGSTNLGLRDQRLGLQWVAENVRAFGGDPTKVTIWGESAGSISAFDHLIINGGDNTYNGQAMFRGAIMDSGSVTPADNVTSSQAQNIYDSVVDYAGCSSSTDTLACLRDLDYTTLLNACNSVPGILSYRSIDLSYLPRPDPGDNFFPESPEVPLAAGDYAKVPIIIGDQEDEGTLFALFQSNITTTQELIDYLVTYFPNNDDAETDVTELVSLYPDDLGISGSPYNTGLLNNIYPQFKRLAAILGDIAFTLARRNYLDIVSSEVNSWSYLASYLYGTAVLGTFHGSDLLYSYGVLTDLTVATYTIQSYYVAFVNSLDPNGAGSTSPLIEWPQYNTSSPTLLNLLALGNQLIQDDFRTNVSDFLAENPSAFRV